LNLSTGELVWSDETFLIFEYSRTVAPTPDLVFQRTHPDDVALVQQLVDQVSHGATECELEHRLLMPDGSIKYLRVVGHLSEHRPGIREFVGAVTDITDRKRAQEELQQLVDFVPQYIVALGLEGNVILANRVAREYTGLTVDQFRSLEVVDSLFHPDDGKRVRALRQLGLSGNNPFEIEARLRGKDGVYQWFLCRYNPLVEHGSVTRWYATATQIESRKQEEERIRKENLFLEERTRIAQELHDTLLQSFVGASMQLGATLYGLSSDSLVKPKLEQVLQLMNRGIEEGQRAIRGLRSSDFGTMDLVVALSRVPRELAVQPDVDFRVTVNGRQRLLSPPVRYEIYRIGQEALVNAFRHSGAKCIHFELEYADTDLRMWVRDNGCGIDPQVLRSGPESCWGLAGMRERAARVQGLLEICSSATTGTEVRLYVPSGVAFQEAGPNWHGELS
jgi:PAS domain S-box-containing protein